MGTTRTAQERGGMTAWVYISKKFVYTVLAALVGAIALSMLFDMMELARRASDLEISFFLLLGLAALRAPSIAMVAAPYIVLLGAMWTCARLARSSELVVLRAAGVSSIGLAAPVLATAVFLGALSTMVFNPLAAGLLDRFERLETQLFDDKTSLLSVTAEGLWLRQGNFSAHSVIQAKSSNADGTLLNDVSIFFFEENDLFVGRIDADRGELKPGSWHLQNATIRKLDRDAPSRPPETRLRDFYELETELTADQIVDSFAPPETIQFWELPKLIYTLKSQGFSARRHLLHFHSLLAAPLIFAAMALIGAAFSMRHSRFGGLGLMALYAALIGFGAFFVLSVAKALASSGAASAIGAAWAPPLGALILAAGLMMRMEDI
jgi:lipopolysaccharide export system permease protein